jgi:hypothetical protein
LVPNLTRYPACILMVLRQWKEYLQKKLPPSFPKIELLLRPDQRRFPSIPWGVERELGALETLEDVLRDPDSDRLIWQPLREGRQPLVEVPERITGDYRRVVYR